jgi:hypothetical protein
MWHMTLINTIISNYGLIQASDSNITRLGSAVPTPGQKVFQLGFTNAALALAGTYGVGDERMDTWMPACITAYGSTPQPSLKGFAYYLRDRLDSDLTGQQKTYATLIHIVGYVSDDEGTHPEFYFVRNAGSINQHTGEYAQILDAFQVTEDFWTRDYQLAEVQATFAAGGYQSYFNGTPDGRIAFVQFGQIFGTFLGMVWGQPNWRFRAPQSLDELASLVKLQIRTVGTLYEISDYQAPFIGGKPQIESITPPSGTVTL